MTMNQLRLNKRVFDWCKNKSIMCNNWCFSVMSKFENLNLPTLSTDCFSINKRKMLDNISQQMTNRHMHEWQLMIDKENSRSGTGRNKLRNYRHFKRFYEPENYCLVHMPVSHRAAFAKFRCGVAPLKIETGRYINQPVEERFCPVCNDGIEDEEHALIKCTAYEHERSILFDKILEFDNTFTQLTDHEKFIFLFSTDCIVHEVAKTCHIILKNRYFTLYNNIYNVYSQCI